VVDPLEEATMDRTGIPKQIKRIIVGTDFSETAERAVDAAVSLAAQVGAVVSVVHAYELPMYSFPDGVVVSSPDAAKRITTDALQRLEKTVEQRKDSGISIQSTLRMGAPWDELNAIADEEDADVIVVGTHGRRGFSRVMLGSVAERLVRTSVRPLLVIRGDE
jgi:nucleotide-binding universal stress UspA family protein